MNGHDLARRSVFSGHISSIGQIRRRGSTRPAGLAGRVLQLRLNDEAFCCPYFGGVQGEVIDASGKVSYINA